MMIGMLGWCAFRLGDLTTASQAYNDATTSAIKQNSDHFDLALVLLCKGRGARAFGMYEALVGSQEPHPQLRRGMFKVARADLRQALRDHRQLAELPEAAQVHDLLDDAIARLPRLPRLRSGETITWSTSTAAT
jgi:hypothetical protein